MVYDDLVDKIQCTTNRHTRILMVSSNSRLKKKQKPYISKEILKLIEIRERSYILMKQFSNCFDDFVRSSYISIKK